MFVVGHLGDWRRAAAVLFERHSLQGYPAPRRQAGQATAGTLKACAGKSGTPNGAEEADRLIVSADPSHCLNAGGMGRQDYETETLIATFDGLDTARTLTRRYDSSPCDDRGPDVIAFSAKDHGGDAMEDCSPTLRAGGHLGSHANAGVMPAIAFAQNTRDEVREMAVVGALAANPGMKQTSYIRQSSAVRRLTPMECERLQGFPDGYTRVPYRNKPAADGPRYKALGNSMAVPCMAWIGQRIAMVDAMQVESLAA